jgi:mRNA interferase MazF
MAQITKAKQSSWPGDFSIQNVESGLPEQCIVRMKLFTIDNRLIQKRTGRLSASDQEQMRTGLRQFMPL